MIVVTGASGLLGSALIQALAPLGIHIKALYHTTPLPNYAYNNVLPTQVDILDIVALQQVMIGATQVYHCAGLVSFAPNDAALLFKINVEGTTNVVNACLAASVQKLVHVSSVAALGRLRHLQTINETMQWTPQSNGSHYGYSKYLGEMEVWRGHAEGLQVAIINPTIILGYANWQVGSAQLFKSVANGFEWYSTGSTGFVLASDVAKAMVLLMQSNINGQRYIVSENNYTYQQILNCMAKGFGKPALTKKVTPFIAAVIWRIEKLKSFFTSHKPLITKETAASALAQVQFDNTKLLKALPQFAYSNTLAGIIDICNQFKTSQ